MTLPIDWYGPVPSFGHASDRRLRSRPFERGTLQTLPELFVVDPECSAERLDVHVRDLALKPLVRWDRVARRPIGGLPMGALVRFDDLDPKLAQDSLYVAQPRWHSVKLLAHLAPNGDYY